MEAVELPPVGMSWARAGLPALGPPPLKKASQAQGGSKPGRTRGGSPRQASPRRMQPTQQRGAPGVSPRVTRTSGAGGGAMAANNPAKAEVTLVMAATRPR